MSVLIANELINTSTVLITMYQLQVSFWYNRRWL